jgi:CheY-like chemotaxis protein
VPHVRATEDRLIQVFLNLLVNAAQALPVGHVDRYRIEVTTETVEDGRALICIRDNGVGIAGEDLARIYEPFFTTKNVGEGTGLGLAICRSIVLGLGGDIAADSQPGAGSTFRIWLPAAATPPTAVVPPRMAVTGRRILVVDDEPMIGRLLQVLLERDVVIAETSARVALDRIHGGERFDRILCDLMMPELSGMDFYDALPAEHRACVVFLTGGAFTERARGFLDGVPNRRLAKPFDVDELAAMLADRPPQ